MACDRGKQIEPKVLNELKINNSSFYKISKLDRNDKEIRKQQTNDSAWKSLQFRKKGQRLTFDEKVYVYSFLKQEGVEAKHIIQNLCISSGTLFNICQSLDEETIHWSNRKTNSTRHITQSEWIIISVSKYISEKKNPYKSQARSEHWLNI